MQDSVYSIFNDDDGLNAREREFCHMYLLNGCDAAKVYTQHTGLTKKICFRLLQRPNVRRYIKKRIAKLEEQLQVTFNQKYLKLWHIAQVCFPDDATTPELRFYKPEAAVSAIKEMNAMVGDNAPKKHIVEERDDIDAVNQILDDLKEKYKKDY